MAVDPVRRESASLEWGVCHRSAAKPPLRRPDAWIQCAAMAPRPAITVLVVWLAICIACLPAQSQDNVLRGVALIVGQEDYAHLPDLANPGNDVRAIQKLLTDLGFEARAVSNRDHARLARDLERFAEDAAEADVALLYYSGHGIEASGENYLLPIDADVSSLADATRTLVPLSQVMNDLQSSVPLSILMLDACRDSPFPPGSMLAAGTSSVSLPIGTTGLAATRGMEVLEERSGEPARQILIGFAAAPGSVALDGPAGGNSPYAAALLKHLGAARGHGFGDIMTMVSQEVYLQTAGRQQPWVSANLRHLLYFGLAPEEPVGDEALIAHERRKLLLTIASTPEEIRKTVEAVALADNVPLATLYGMLNALEVDTATGSGEDLATQLRAGAENLKTILADRDLREKVDPELIRLSHLAGTAEREGAIALARDFRGKASARADAISKALDTDEANIRARRIEVAQTYAEEAETAILDFDYKAASQKYAAAYEQVKGRDDLLARRYKLAEATTLTDYGAYKGDNEALITATRLLDAALAITSKTDFPGDWAGLQMGRGNALQLLGTRETGTETLAKAIEAYEAAIGVWVRGSQPSHWAQVQSNLASTYIALGHRVDMAGNVRRAIAAFEAALAATPRERGPQWATIQNNLGAALNILGQVEGESEHYRQALKAFDAALLERARDRVPLDWAATQTNLAIALAKLGEAERDTSSLRHAVQVYKLVLEVYSRDSTPLMWATIQNNLGSVLKALGERENDTSLLQGALAAFVAALEERTRTRTPLEWASSMSSVGDVYASLGARLNGKENLRKAIEAYELVLQERTPQNALFQWVATQNNLGLALSAIGMNEGDTAALQKAAVTFQKALELLPRDQAPYRWALLQQNRGTALRNLGERANEPRTLQESAAAFRSALLVRSRETQADLWAESQHALGDVLLEIATREPGTANLERAIEALDFSLEHRTRARAPREWAVTRRKLGLALALLGRRTGQKAILQRAIETLDEAYRQAGASYSLTEGGDIFYNLGWAHAKLADAESGRVNTQHLDAAIEAWRKAQRFWPKATTPHQWAQVQNLIGYHLTLIGEADEDLNRFAVAVPLLREGFAVQLDLNTMSAVYTADSLCRALLGLGRLKRDRATLEEAKQLCEDAAAFATTHKVTKVLEDSLSNLEKIKATLEKL